MEKITVVGVGYVGLVEGLVFAEMGNDVLCFDENVEKIDMLNRGVSPFFEPGLEEMLKRNLIEGRIGFTDNIQEAYKNPALIFVSVGTPQSEKGNANLSSVFEVAVDIAKSIKNDCLVVIKSTVPVGTCNEIEKLIIKENATKFSIEVSSNPEFLSQGSALNDALHPNRIVIGTNSLKAEKTLKDLYSAFKAPVVSVSRESSEMIKYASNCFLAVKISYINEVANLCEAVGADILEVSEGMKYDPRIGEAFLKAGIGFGGGCLPKDAVAFLSMAKAFGIPLDLVGAAIKTNEAQKMDLLMKAKKHFGSLKGMRILVLGLTFKPNTDDLRNSPALENISYFLEEGALVSVYDPIAIPSFKKNVLSQKVRLCSSLREALVPCQAIFIFTEWNDIKELTPKDFLFQRTPPVIFDGRNLFDKKEMENAGLVYYSIGR